MGAGVFHGRVRDGNGCINPAMATRPPDPIKGFGGDVWIGVFVVLRVDGAACGARLAGVVLSVLW